MPAVPETHPCWPMRRVRGQDGGTEVHNTPDMSLSFMFAHRSVPRSRGTIFIVTTSTRSGLRSIMSRESMFAGRPREFKVPDLGGHTPPVAAQQSSPNAFCSVPHLQPFTSSSARLYLHAKMREGARCSERCDGMRPVEGTYNVAKYPEKRKASPAAGNHV